MVIPAYNEDDRLGIMLDEAMEYFVDEKHPGMAGDAELLVVDDGSTDATTRTAQVLAGKWEGRGVDIRVITLKRNRGKGGAVQHVRLLRFCDFMMMGNDG